MEAIASAANRPGVHVLDSHGDPDHNRFVLTVASTSEQALTDGLLAAAAEAVHRIDLRTHVGVHPRVGAADVIPIVPLAGTDLGACSALAHALGRRLWSELRVPVYFYGAAALRPETVRLASIRSGGLEPDLGGPALSPSAGAVCVGARPLLVAYNVLLPGARLEEAQALARALRESSGGRRGVQALAFALRSGTAQLSMNLVDLETAPPPRLMEALRRMAAEAGLETGAEEVVGLCPARYASAAAGGRLLEGRLAAAGARAGAAACHSLGGSERDLVAGRLEAEAVELAALPAEPEAILAGAERAAAAIRVLRAAGALEDDAGVLLTAASSGFRAAVDADRWPERVAALDRWLP